MERTSRSGLIYSPYGVNVVDKTFCIFIALLPFICIYNFPFIDVSVGTVLLILFLPHLLIKIQLGKVRRTNTRSTVFLVFILYIYLSFRSEGNARQIVLNLTAAITLWAISKGALNENLFRRYLENFAIFNSALVALQVGSHYLLGRNLQFVQFSLLQADYRATYGNALSLFSLYRPTGLFLEPAYFSEYCLFALISCLFPIYGKPNFRRAAFICFGIILTTSGMGIVLMTLILALYVFLNREKLDKKIKRGAALIVLFVIAMLILSRFSFFNQALQRVFSSYEGYNALEGRTGSWQRAISSLNSTERMFGLGGEHKYVFYLSGFPDTIYRFGIIGVVLELLVFVNIIFKKRNGYILSSCLVYVVLFCVAHLTGVFLQVFYYSIVLIGLLSNESETINLR